MHKYYLLSTFFSFNIFGFHAQAANPSFKPKCEMLYADLKSQCADKQDELERALAENRKLKSELSALRSKASGLRDPNWKELVDFIKADPTDNREYKADKYNCEDFSIALRDAARDRNLRCAYVTFSYRGTGSAHAITAFETTDHGLVYVEPQGDQIAYVKVGKAYNSIPIDAVKRRYFSCPTDPHGFARPLNQESYMGRMFEYEYFENYSARVACHRAGLNAYNAAVNDYNAGGKRFRNWDFDAWLNNLDSFADELVLSKFSPATDIVANVKARWN